MAIPDLIGLQLNIYRNRDPNEKDYLMVQDMIEKRPYMPPDMDPPTGYTMHSRCAHCEEMIATCDASAHGLFNKIINDAYNNNDHQH